MNPNETRETADTEAALPSLADRIDAAILAYLRRDPDELFRWRNVRRILPGDLDAQTEALNRLWNIGSVYLLSLRGEWLVGLGDEGDRLIAAKYRSEGAPRPAVMA